MTSSEQTFIIQIYQIRTDVSKRFGTVRIQKVAGGEMKKTKHIRIVNPVRFFLFVLISIMIIVFAGYSIIGAGRADAAAVKTYKQVVIHEGDNLWDIAEECNPDSGRSIRSIIGEICETNDVNVNDIQPGDMIFVPVY